MSKPAWGDIDDDEMEFGAGPVELLPETKITGPDQNGIKTIVEYSFDNDGKRVRTTKKVKVTMKKVRINKMVQARREWAKFGDCKSAPKGPEPMKTSFGDDVALDLTPKVFQKKAQEDEKITVEKLQSNVVVCRRCKGDHWTLKCPFKDQLPTGGDAGPPRDERDDGKDVGPTRPSGPSNGKYIPPSLRAAGGGRKDVAEARRSIQNQEDTAALRVTNLSEDADEQDLQNIFRQFGAIHRIYLVRDRETDISRGFAFVHFLDRSNAEKAMHAVNGLPYDHQILEVDWAKPREN